MTAAPDEKAQVDANLNALAFRLVGLLLLLGGGVMLALLAAIRQLPTAFQNQAMVYVIPGTGGHVIDPTILLVLAGVGGLLAGAGTLGLIAGHRAARTPSAGVGVPTRVNPARIRRPFVTLAIGAIVLAAAIAFRWHLLPF